MIKLWKRWAARRELLFAAQCVAVSYTPELQANPYDPDDLHYLQTCAVRLAELEGKAGTVFSPVSSSGRVVKPLSEWAEGS